MKKKSILSGLIFIAVSLIIAITWALFMNEALKNGFEVESKEGVRIFTLSIGFSFMFVKFIAEEISSKLKLINYSRMKMLEELFIIFVVFIVIAFFAPAIAFFGGLELH